jgi:hypothetical protein
MMGRKQVFSSLRLVSILLGVALALLMGISHPDRPLIGSKSLAQTAATAIRISITIKNRKLVNEVQRQIRITQGDLLELVFTADESAELHLHGYDIYLNVEPGTPGVLRVDAKIAGRFPLEAHRFGSATAEPNAKTRDHVVLLYLEIYPR